MHFGISINFKNTGYIKQNIYDTDISIMYIPILSAFSSY